MSDERKTHPTVPAQVKPGDLMALIHYVKVTSTLEGGGSLIVQDLDDSNKEIQVKGASLVARAFSADQFAEEIKISKTAAAELLISSYNRPFTVCFEKTDGTKRTLRGRLVKPEPLLGRSMVEDLDLPASANRLRLVDHRTLEVLVVDGIRYAVK